MYHPVDRADGKNLEFIEIYNSSPWAEDLSGYQLRGDVGRERPMHAANVAHALSR